MVDYERIYLSGYSSWNIYQETSVKALKFFNELIGKYSYPTLSVVEANFVHGGMEFPNLVYISNEIKDYISHDLNYIIQELQNNEFKIHRIMRNLLIGKFPGINDE